MAGTSGSTRTARRGPVKGSETEHRLQVVDLVGLLPGESAVVTGTAEVPVGGRTPEDRPAEVEMVEDGGGPQIEHVFHRVDDLGRVDLLGAERLDHHRD